ncbi:hypothetical protein LINPERHAP1_LOCUS30707 [Linum perenne]
MESLGGRGKFADVDSNELAESADWNFPEDFVPCHINYFFLISLIFFSSSYLYFDDSVNTIVNTNEFYNAGKLYLSSSVSVSTSRLSLTRTLNSSIDTFDLSNRAAHSIYNSNSKNYCSSSLSSTLLDPILTNSSSDYPMKQDYKWE